MYNRYVPQPDGSYRRNRMPDRNPPQRKPPAKEPCEKACKNDGCEEASLSCHPVAQHSQKEWEKPAQSGSIGSFFKNFLPKDFDTSDLVVLLLLLLIAGDCAEDKNTALLTLVLYLFL